METFNPIKEEDGKKAKRIVWSTATLNKAIDGLKRGRKLVANPFYENNIKLLKGDLLFERTPEEVEEWKRCKDDILYFVEKYVKFLTPEGIQNVKLRDYQKKYLKHLEKNQLSIMISCRQAGKTTTTGAFLLHYVCFNFDKNTMVLGNKRKTAIEILDKMRKMFVELPFFLKPGIYKWNEGEIAFDNVCRIQAEATTANSGIGQTLACVIWDEAAHVAPNIIDKFYTNIFPTITAANAKFLISSTQNGRNLFYRIYKAAEREESDYKPFKTDWYEVPDWDEVNHYWVKRDENWHQRQIANYGSEEAFNSQFGTDFDLGSNTLISNKVLKRLECVKFVNKDLPGVSYNECWYWHPEYDPMNLKQERILTTCDLAEGIGQDYTVFSIYRIINQKLECIGYFRSNQVIRKDCARSLMELYTKWVSQGCGLISLEYNTYGEIFINEMRNLADSELPSFDDYCIIKYYSEGGRNYRLGIKLNSANKSAYCRLFKESIERNEIINEAEDFIFELQNFSDTGNGHYKASFGHDDMVMTGVQLEFAKQTLQYKLLYDEAQTQSTTPDTIWNPYSQNSDDNTWNPYSTNQTLY